MIDVYNSLLKMAPVRLESLLYSAEIAPSHMPTREEIVQALTRFSRGTSARGIVDDPVLRRVLRRMAAVNEMVKADALLERCEPEAILVGAGVLNCEAPLSGPWARSNSGEMICPECGDGSLCYLIGNISGAFVECSTVDCLYWDARR